MKQNKVSLTTASARPAAEKGPLADYPRAARVEAFVVDMNGVPRGKSLPRAAAGKLLSSGLRMPRSSFALDIWGQDVIAAGLVAETGDNDGLCRPVDGRLQPMTWAGRLPHRVASPRAIAASAAVQVLMSMYDDAGRPFFADPRHVLARVLARYRKAGLFPVVALEPEFYLMDAAPDERGRPQPPRNPATGRRAHQAQTYGLAEAADFGHFFDDMAIACQALGLPAEGMLSENGPAQFEINLHHRRDALAAADDVFMLKRAVKGVAGRHGMMASFMAKPYATQSGNGMHVHLSILDRTGRNIFEGVADKGNARLRHAVAGILSSLPACMAVLAPHANSYRRFAAGSHAPTRCNWGYDNRSAAVRIPAGVPEATRLECRVAGADANPYLVLAVLLSAALEGLMAEARPPRPVEGDASAVRQAALLPLSWSAALSAFSESSFIDRALGSAFKKVFLACKMQEKALIDAEVSSVEHDAYLRDC